MLENRGAQYGAAPPAAATTFRFTCRRCMTSHRSSATQVNGYYRRED